MAELLGHRTTVMVDKVYGKVENPVAAAWVAKLGMPQASLGSAAANVQQTRPLLLPRGR